LTQFNELSQCRDGLMCYNKNDHYIGGALHFYGEFSYYERQLFERILDIGQVVVEVGANMGAHTLPLSRFVRDTGIVVAFEPQRLLFQTLCANMAINSRPNVLAYNAALGAAKGIINVPPLNHHAEQSFGSLSLLGNLEGDPIPMQTLDDLNLKHCDFIKVDVEGMERDVILGATLTLKRHRPILYVENDQQDKSPALIAEIMARGYRLYWHLPPLFNPDNFRKRDINLYSGIISINMLCIPVENPFVMEGLTEITDPMADWRLV
jgi:FkbM family methyltransferase